MPTLKNLYAYKELLNNIYYWKMGIYVYYNPMEFRFKNVSISNGGATLKVFGIVPKFEPVELTKEEYFSRKRDLVALNQNPEDTSYDIGYWAKWIKDQVEPEFAAGKDKVTIGFNLPEREYLIYQERRYSEENRERWQVTIPQVCTRWGNLLEGYKAAGKDWFGDGAQIQPGFEYDYTWGVDPGFDPSKPGANVTYNTAANEVVGIPKRLNLPDKYAFDGFAQGPTSDRRFTTENNGPYNRANTNTGFGGDGTFRLYLNWSERLSSPKGVYEYYQKYNAHPHLIFSPDFEVSEWTRKLYGRIPIGIHQYRVQLDLGNGESVSRKYNRLDPDVKVKDGVAYVGNY